MSNCPKCDRSLTYLAVKRIDIKEPGMKWSGITLSCPHCDVCVSAAVDPLKLGNELLASLKAARSRMR